MPIFDGDNLIMTLDAPVDGVLNLDTETDWYSEWKKWTLLDDNMRYEDAFELIISEELTPGIESGAYFFFRNNAGWRVRPYEADATIYLNGNLVPRDSSLPIMIPTIGAYTVLIAGLQPITQNIDTIKESLAASTFVGKEGLGIFIDPINGVDSGTEIPGNGEFPIKTETVMHTLVDEKGFDYIYVRNSLNLTGDHSVGHVFIASRQSININCDVGSNVTGCTFKDCNISGKLDPAVIIERSIVYSITNANFYIDYSALYGPLVLSDDLKINNCSISTDKTDQECIIDFNNLAKTVLISEWSAGRIRVKNMVTGSFIGMAGNAGRLIIDEVNSGGTAVYAGGILVDRTWESKIDTLQDSSTAGAVWDHAVEGTYTAEQVMRIMSAALAGKASGLDTLNPVFRDLSDTKNRITATTDASGNRSAVTVDGA